MAQVKPRPAAVGLVVLLVATACAGPAGALASPVAASPVAALPVAIGAGSPDMAPRLDASGFPAAGHHETRLLVPHTGRYRIAVKSGTGVALTLVDRMLGDVAEDGTPGKRDGRLDVLLDAGAYLVRLTGAKGATGKATLTARRFRDAQPGRVPVLQEDREVDTTLGDGERRAFWIDVAHRGPVLVEAAGRRLEGLQLWRGGRYRLKVERQVHPKLGDPGRPQRDVRLAAVLDPGRYLLTAYGGNALPWPAGGHGAPLEVRLGVPSVAKVSVTRGRVPAYGVARFRVPAPAGEVAVHLALDRPGAATLEAMKVGPAHLLGYPARYGRIDEKSRHPQVTVDVSAEKADAEIAVRARPGTAFTLTVLQDPDDLAIRVPESGAYWLSVVGSTPADDGLEASGIVSDGLSGVERMIASSAPHLSRDAAFRQTLNLKSRTAAVLIVDEPGLYRVDDEGVDLRFTLQRLLVTPRQDARLLVHRPGAVLDLSAGVYELILHPIRAGVARIRVAPAGDRVTSFETPPRVRLGVQIPKIFLGADDTLLGTSHDYGLVIGIRPGDRRALVLRRLPLTLKTPLPVDLAPGVPVGFPVEVKGAERLEVHGAKAAITVDGRPCAGGCTVGRGRHEVRLVLATGDERFAMVRLVPEAEARRAEAPVLTRALPPPDPRLLVPEVSPGVRRFFDVPRHGARTFRLEVRRPAIYRVETTGLLATTVTLRTRAALDLDSENGGGAGRNGRVVHFLRAGEYLVRVAVRGRSTGHAGLLVARAPVVDGGALVAGRRAPATVAAGAGLAYTFRVDAAGRYRLRTLSLGQHPPVRLTDLAGWPVATVDHAPDLTVRLDPGRYRWLVEGVDVPGRRVTRIDRIRPPRTVTGRGPHALDLGEAVGATWIEGDGKPDVYTFRLPAKVGVRISLGNDRMEARVYRADDPSGATRTPVVTVAPGHPFAGTLAAGGYRLEVVCSRVDTGLPYRVRVTVDALVAGTTRTVSVPGTVDVIVARPGTAVLTSFGDRDVRGVLRDAAGHLVAENDDAPDDWNFRLAPRLAPGRYRLSVAGVGGIAEVRRIAGIGGATGTTEVHLATPGITDHRPIAVPGRARLDLAGSIVRVPIPIRRSGLLRVRVACAAGAEVRLADGDRVLARGAGKAIVLAAHVTAGRPLRLSVLADTASKVTADLRMDRLAPAPRVLRDRGRSWHVAGDAMRIEVRQAGTFSVTPAAGLRIAVGDRALEPADAADLSLPVGTAWLLWPRGPRRVHVRRVILARGHRTTALVPGARRVLDLAPAPGLLLARVEGDGGRPAASFVAWRAPGGPGHGTDLDLGQRSCLAASAPGVHRPLVLWNAGASTAPDPVTVTRCAVPVGRGTELRPGTTPLTLPPGGVCGATARRFVLPGRPVALHLGLARGLAAVAWDRGHVEAVVDASAAPVDRHLVVTATHLAIVDLAGRGGDAVVVRRAPASVLDHGPAAGRPWARRFDAPGRTDLDVPAGAVAVRIAGPATAAALDGSGHLVEGRRLALPAGGRLVVHHGAGIVSVWLEGAAHPNLDRWGPLSNQPASPVRSDAVLALSGPVRWLSVHLSRPTVLSVAAGDDVLVAVSRQVGGASTDSVARRLGALAGDPLAAVAQGSLVRVLGQGDYLVGLRARAGGGLTGVVRLAADPVHDLSGGVGPETLLAAGESRVYAFIVPSARKVGVGVRTSADVVDASLLDATGARIAGGRQAIVHLKPGRYLLRVRCPPGQGPVRVAPVVLGLSPPGGGPPPAALAKLLTAAGLVSAHAPEGR